MQAIPTFGVPIYAVAIDFYVDFLGFSVDWEHRFAPRDPVYMQISKGGLILHLSEYKRFVGNAIVYVSTSNLRGFHQELKEKHPFHHLPDIVITDWQTLQLEIEDPFGNLLRFNENA